MGELELHHHLRVHRWRAIARHLVPQEMSSRRRSRRGGSHAGEVGTAVGRGRRGGHNASSRGRGRPGRRGEGGRGGRDLSRERAVNGQVIGVSSRGRKRRRPAKLDTPPLDVDGVDLGTPPVAAALTKESTEFDACGAGDIEEEGEEEDEDDEEDDDEEGEDDSSKSVS